MLSITKCLNECDATVETLGQTKTILIKINSFCKVF